ncbi:hypothetical protein R7Q09_24000, partial [Vibrio sp. 2130-1]|nr:hypothetical protein [Vibrio sp. 2130-1]
TDSVKVESPGSTDASGEQTAKVTWVGTIPSNDTTVNITAEFNLEGSPLSVTETTSVTFKMLGICGGKFNDKDKSNAKGACLKVRDIYGTLFTGTPSEAALNQLGYTKDSHHDNRGKTYGTLGTETSEWGPAGGKFGLFYNTGIGGTQYQRYCENLADLNFAGRNNWSHASRTDLDYLFRYTGNVWTSYGWATRFTSWTNEINSDTAYVVHLGNGGGGFQTLNYAAYATCVSK